MGSPCIFCKVISGDIPSSKVFENESVLGFKDIQPQAPLHYLFVPKKHYDSLADIPSNELEIMGEIFKAIRSVVDKEALEKSGFRTTINTGAGGGQTVFHLHVHLMSGRKMGPNMVGA